MSIHWKAVEQYFTVVLFNPLTPRVKPWVIQSFLTFYSMDRTLKCDHSLKRCFSALTLELSVLYCLFFNVAQLVILDLALSGMKGLRNQDEKLVRRIAI